VLHGQRPPRGGKHEDVPIWGDACVTGHDSVKEREIQKKESDEGRASRSRMKRPETLCTQERCEAHAR
jgi:hypothetical protein